MNASKVVRFWCSNHVILYMVYITKDQSSGADLVISLLQSPYQNLRIFFFIPRSPDSTGYMQVSKFGSSIQLEYCSLTYRHSITHIYTRTLKWKYNVTSPQFQRGFQTTQNWNVWWFLRNDLTFYVEIDGTDHLLSACNV